MKRFLIPLAVFMISVVPAGLCYAQLTLDADEKVLSLDTGNFHQAACAPLA